MPQMRHLVGAIGLAVAGSLVGCVPAEQYAAMKVKADQYAEQLAHSQTDVSTANARADSLQQQLQSINNSTNAQQALENSQATQISDLQKQNEGWNQRYADAMKLAAQAGDRQALPTPLNDELKDFAAKSPDLIDFDPARGVVKFKSDVTFPAGDASVTAAAKPVLAQFATILDSAGADHYELLVAGHTDSTPVTNKSTIARGNFDNWYLSTHRAISVGKELIADGVSPRRLGMVGYADERPVASNATEAGKTQNRRVEVLILPTTAKGGSSYAAAPAAHSHHTRTPAAPMAVPASAVMSKDAPPAAVMSK